MPNTEENISNNGIPEISFTVEPSQNVQTPVDKTLSIDEMAADAKATGDAIANVQSAVSDVAADVLVIQGWSGEDLKVDSTQGADTIADAISGINDEITGIKAWTGEDINVNTAQNAETIAEAIAGIQEDIGTIQEWTGDDIPYSAENSTPISSVIASIFSQLYPVGSLYVSAEAIVPASLIAIGTWTEVAIPLTWGDIHHGTRSYVEVTNGYAAGSLHYWLRTA